MNDARNDIDDHHSDDGQQLNLPLVSPGRLPTRAAAHRIRQAESALRAARTQKAQRIDQARQAVHSAKVAAARRATQS